MTTNYAEFDKQIENVFTDAAESIKRTSGGRDLTLMKLRLHRQGRARRALVTVIDEESGRLP